MEWRQRERVPLPEGSEITINGITVVNTTDKNSVAAGSSCLVYRGYIKNDNEEGMIGNSVIIKEFYPDLKNKENLFDIIRNAETGQLEVSDATKEKEEYKNVLEQFCQGVKIQKELASSEAMEIAIKPLASGTYGDSYYIISDAHRGEDLKQTAPETLKEKMIVAVCMAETMGILHEAGYMMPDYKPANFLWIKKPNLVKIIDVDSLIAYRHISKKTEELLFINSQYLSPEIELLERYYKEGISPKEFARKKRFYLTPLSDMYVIGKYLYQLFWNQPFEKRNMKEMNEEWLIEEFIELYKDEKEASLSKLRQAAKGMIDIIGRMLISDLMERTDRCYEDAEQLMNALNDIYFGYTSKKYVPRKEVAKANATFVAYNMLQKKPLFEYADTEDGILQLKAAIVGNHAMRKEMLSAIITIGQMTDADLTVSVVAEDAKEFWEDYISEAKNVALRAALTWSVDGQMVSDEIDQNLVARSLAHVSIVTDESEVSLKRIKEEGCRYFVLLSEEERLNQRRAEYLAGENIFIGCLQDEEETSFYPISAGCYSEYYNEKMFEEKIFDMGLMVHAYYCGCLDNIDSVDMDELKEGFRKNLYNVASSERCALHAMYKMACVGLHGNVPRKAKRFEKMLDDPEILEKLAWIEHLSWSADLLTNGAAPLHMEDFAEHAYQGENDWKNKSDPDHLKHPLLVASQKEVPKADWREKENFDRLDELDKVSHGIYHWFIEQKEHFRDKIGQLLEKWIPEEEKELQLKESIEAVLQKCIDGIGQETMNQDQTNIKEWKRLAKESEPYSDVIKEIENIMRPVIDSYKDRDFKELDRKLVYVAADIIR